MLFFPFFFISVCGDPSGVGEKPFEVTAKIDLSDLWNHLILCGCTRNVSVNHTTFKYLNRWLMVSFSVCHPASTTIP